MRLCIFGSYSCVPGGKLGVLKGHTNSTSISAEVMVSSSFRPMGCVEGRVMPSLPFGLGRYRSLIVGSNSCRAWCAGLSDKGFGGLRMAHSKSGDYNLFSSGKVLEFLRGSQCWFHEIEVAAPVVLTPAPPTVPDLGDACDSKPDGAISFEYHPRWWAVGPHGVSHCDYLAPTCNPGAGQFWQSWSMYEYEQDRNCCAHSRDGK